MSTCHWVDLQALGCQPVMPKNLSDDEEENEDDEENSATSAKQQKIIRRRAAGGKIQQEIIRRRGAGGRRKSQQEIIRRRAVGGKIQRRLFGDLDEEQHEGGSERIFFEREDDVARQPGATGRYPLVHTCCRFMRPHGTAAHVAAGGVVPPGQDGPIGTSLPAACQQSGNGLGKARGP